MRVDRFIVVDWSAASVPRRGADSVWWALVDADGVLLARDNAPTRALAIADLVALLAAERGAGRRALIGFDFPFGYPAGMARRLFGAEDWRGVWAGLAAMIEDAPDNANNRAAVAATLNRRVDRAAGGPFWGDGSKAGHDGLPRKKPRDAAPDAPREWRLAEAYAKSAKPGRPDLRGDPKSVWQLAGAGAVGGQALVGIAALERLRHDRRIAADVAVWPFETGLAPPTTPIIIAEIYPSLIDSAPLDGEVKDAAQVRATAQWLAAAQAVDELAALFEGPADLDAAARASVVREEAWILGLTHRAILTARVEETLA